MHTKQNRARENLSCPVFVLFFCKVNLFYIDWDQTDFVPNNLCHSLSATSMGR